MRLRETRLGLETLIHSPIPKSDGFFLQPLIPSGMFATIKMKILPLYSWFDHLAHDITGEMYGPLHSFPD